MTTVLLGDGRTVTLTDDAKSGTVGEVADAIGHDAHGHDGAFSFKVDGHLIHPSTSAGQVALVDGHTIELVEVTDQNWSTPDAGAPAGVIRVEVPTGTVEDLIEWVGEDRERAEAVIATEELQDDPRTTLLHHLRSHFDLPDDDNEN